MTRDLVTGANGHIGATTIRSLLRRGHEVIPFVRTESDLRGIQKLGLEMVYGDVRDYDSLAAAAQGCQAIIHLASVYRMWVKDPAEIMDPACCGTENIFRVARQVGIERMIYTSSVVAVGTLHKPEGLRTPSDWIEDPKATYYIAKADSERLALKLAMRPRPDIPRSRLEETKTGDEPVSTPAPRDRRPPGPRASEDQREARPSRPVTAKDLKLSDKELIKALGSRVNDYLENVEEGGQTLLNSKRWRFASFFNRVKRQVAENWRPGAVYRRRDPRGNVYGFRDRLTILRVRLTPKGRLKDVHLETASGVGFLDDEAMSAFRAAEPFPNPPRGLVDKDSGMISFRFGFLFEISRRPSFRIFRQR